MTVTKGDTPTPDEDAQAIFETFAGPAANPKTDELFDQALQAMRAYQNATPEDLTKARLEWALTPWNRCQSVTRLYSTFVRCDLTRKHRSEFCAAERGMETVRWTTTKEWSYDHADARPDPQISLTVSQAILVMGVGTAGFLAAAYEVVSILRQLLN